MKKKQIVKFLNKKGKEELAISDGKTFYVLSKDTKLRQGSSYQLVGGEELSFFCSIYFLKKQLKKVIYLISFSILYMRYSTHSLVVKHKIMFYQKVLKIK